MAKLQVTDPSDGTVVPFLRGILTRSLQLAGLQFDDAYAVASDIREQFTDRSNVRTDELRDIVADHLHKSHGDAVVQRYRTMREATTPIIVRTTDGQAVPFSIEKHRRALESCGLSDAVAAKLTGQLYRHLVLRKRHDISSAYLGRLTYRYLHRDAGEETARRFLVWREFRDKGWPLLLLIGGAPGCGKSTVATEVASRLDIFRTQSTDMLREVMRMMIPERLLPVLYRSSFDAWKALPTDESEKDGEHMVERGYRAQTELLTVPCEAVVQRAVRERVSLVLEGVHVDASLFKRLTAEQDMIVIPVMLAVLRRDQLKNRIQGRGGSVPQRRAKRYLQNFDAIWQLQSYLLDEADRAGVPMVSNDDKEESIREIMRIIVDHLSGHLELTVDKVFPR